MEKTELEKGDILQIYPEHANFPGFLLVVDEPTEFGAQGYLVHDRDFEAVRFKGIAYLRVKFEEVEFCGTLNWMKK